MIAAWLLGILIGILIVIHMARPRFERRTLSAARFFSDLPPARKGQPRWGLSNPLLSRPFYLQLLILALLLIAMLTPWGRVTGDAVESIGIWFLMDASASMSTMQNDTTRIMVVHQEIEQAISKLEELRNDIDPCIRLSAFDLERRDILETKDLKTVVQGVNAIEHRPLGTDLNLIHSLFDLFADQSELQCKITHLIVVSDLPVPEWFTSNDTVQVVWRDIGQPVDNMGFTNLQVSRNPLTGLIREVSIEVSAFGQPPSQARITVVAETGEAVLNESLKWLDDNTWQGKFSPGAPGQYYLSLSPDDAYGYDNNAVIEISDGQNIQVDWQLDDRSLSEQLGWEQNKTQPHLRVVSQQIPGDLIPTLIVGNDYPQDSRSQIEILDFYEPSPLLADLNFDVAESLGIQGVELPDGFAPVLRGLDGKVWLAQRNTPPAAYISGLPYNTDDNLGQFSTTVFFNAIRWLLKERSLPPLYTLTTPDAPAPTGNRLALHEDEGNTAHIPQSLGDFNNLQTVSASESETPIWPILLAIVALLLLIERSLAAFGGEKWR